MLQKCSCKISTKTSKTLNCPQNPKGAERQCPEATWALALAQASASDFLENRFALSFSSLKLMAQRFSQ